MKEMRKPTTTDKIRTAFADARAVGLKRRAYCILGMPSESLESVAKTERLIDEIDPDIVGFTVMAPYPGNQFYKPEYRDIDWSSIDEYANGLTASKYLANEDLRNIQKRLTNKYRMKLTDRQRVS